jgi:hypothetical protein
MRSGASRKFGHEESFTWRCMPTQSGGHGTLSNFAQWPSQQGWVLRLRSVAVFMRAETLPVELPEFLAAPECPIH